MRIDHVRIVLDDRIVRGSVVLEDGVIAAVEADDEDDGKGDLLIPGLVDLHTDHLEKHYQPRQGVEWNPVAAALAHDAMVATSGITTVFDSLVLGSAPGWDTRDEMLRPMLDGLDRARAGGMFRADHRLHLRLEVTHERVAELLLPFVGDPSLAFLSLMDHAPGDRQSPDIEEYRRRYQRNLALSDVDVDHHVTSLMHASKTYGPPNRRRLSDISREHRVPIASHDDATVEHIDEAHELGCVLTEFPTTLAAARRAREKGLAVLMGSPNLVRGGSHSGNVAAKDLAREGLLDVLASDYVPISLLHAAFLLAGPEFGWTLPKALATVTSSPAAAAGLQDRGRIAPGLRADLVRIEPVDGVPVVREVYTAGRRVA